MSNIKANKKVLTMFSLIMINVIAVDNLKTLPLSAKLGMSLVSYYIVCAICFFIPVALVTAELATTWPKKGGIYVWVKEAFGPKAGFLVIWLQWVYNIVWYPTILGLVAGVAAFLVEPELADHSFYVFNVVLIVFWFATLINFAGMKISSLVSTIGTIVGTLLPMLMIICLGIYWYTVGGDLAIEFSWDDLVPEINQINDLVLVTAILFGLLGLEMSAVHASEVKNPSKTYPRALTISGTVILLSLVFASIAIAIVVPRTELHIVTGMIQAFRYFFEMLNVPWMLPIMAVLVIIGAVGSVATWIIGPTKGLLAVAEDGYLSPWFARTNSKGVPVVILIIQGIVVTLLSFAYTMLDSVESAYFILTALTAILALVMYIFMFAAAIKLRYSRASILRPYKIPYGNIGMWLVCILGGGTCLFAMILGFMPPSQINVGDPWLYKILLIVGVIVFCLPAFFIHNFKKAGFLDSGAP